MSEKWWSQWIVVGAGLFCLDAHGESAGRIRYEARDFYEGQVAPVSHFEDNLRLEFEGKYQFNEDWRLRIEPELQLSSTPRLIDKTMLLPFSFPRVETGPLDFNFRDTLIERRWNSVHLQAGSFIKAWEGPDGYNPMDIATVKNFRDPLAPENLGSFGVAANGGGEDSGGIGAVTWDVLYVPRQTPTRLPGENSRWLPRHIHLSLQSEGQQLLLPEQPIYQEDDHRVIHAAFNDNYGGRVQLHRSAWDFSAAYFEGASQLPGISPTISGDLVAVSPHQVIQATNPLEVQAVEYRRRTMAMSAVATGFESWIFRLAGRYDLPIGTEAVVPDKSLQFVGGAERTLSIRGQTVIASLGYAFGQNLKTRSGDFTISDPFASAWMYGVRWPLMDDLILMISGLWSPSVQSAFNSIHLDHKLTDHLSMDGGVQWMHGSANNPLGLWADEDRVSLAASYQF